MIPISISHVPQHLGEVPTTIEATNYNSMGPRDFKPCGYGSKTQKVFDPRMGWTISCNPYDILAKKTGKIPRYSNSCTTSIHMICLLGFLSPKRMPLNRPRQSRGHGLLPNLQVRVPQRPCCDRSRLCLLWVLGDRSRGRWANGACKIHFMNLRRFGYGSKIKSYGTTNFSICLVFMNIMNHLIMGVANFDPYRCPYESVVWVRNFSKGGATPLRNPRNWRSTWIGMAIETNRQEGGYG